MKQKIKVLIIDDEKDFCFFVKNNLEQTGEYEVTYASNPLEGIKIAKQEPPQIILLDILMPQMGGSDVAEVLLQDPRTAKIPIIFLTAVVTEEEIGLGAIKEIGGHNFIAKPVDTERLSSCIKIALKTEEK